MQCGELRSYCSSRHVKFVHWIFINFKDTFETGESFIIIFFHLLFFTYSKWNSDEREDRIESDISPVHVSTMVDDRSVRLDDTQANIIPLQTKPSKVRIYFLAHGECVGWSFLQIVLRNLTDWTGGRVWSACFSGVIGINSQIRTRISSSRKFFLERVEFFVVFEVQSNTMWSYMCMCCGLFAPTQFQFECCGFREDSWWHLYIYIYARDVAKHMKPLWKVLNNIHTYTYTWTLTPVQVYRWNWTALSGKANVWRNRQRVALDLFSNWKWWRSTFLWWSAESRDNHTWANFGKLN